MSIEAWVGTSLLGAAAAWPAAVATVYAADTGADEIHYATTADGLSLSLSRYRASPSAPRRRAPVLLVPGLAANRYGFDIGASVSLARRMRALGYDTYVVELRGAGLSDTPLGRSWTVDTHLELDLPAAIARVLELSGAESLHWIGHSMGGVFGYALLATRPELPVRSCTVIGASLDYSRSTTDFHLIAKALPIGHFVRWLPLGAFSALGAPFAVRSARGTVLDLFNVWPPNVSRPTYRRLSALAFEGVPTALLVQLASAITGGGMLSADGQVNYYESLATFRTPLLSICGDRDRQCPIDAAEDTFERVGSPDRTLLRLGPEHGTQEHYAHWDMHVGLRAPTEVWPHIESFLARQD